MIYFLTVNYYSTNLVNKLISSLRASLGVESKTLIINNSPDDDSIHALKTESVLVLDAPHNLGFGSACNLGLQFIYTKEPQAIAWIINPDAYIFENTLAQVNPFFNLHPEVSILGTIVHTPSGIIWFAGGCFIPATGAILSQNLLANTDEDYVTCDWVSGCSLIVNFKKFRDCPQFDAAYFLYYEDFDFCRRYTNQGHIIAITKQFGVLHQPSSITNKYIFQKIKHSTYSYFLTLDRYTNKGVVILRLTRLLCYASILIVIKPQFAFGKFFGLLIYLRDKYLKIV